MSIPYQLSSMTGFARSDGNVEGHQWVWEVRSVNGRSLEARFRLPYGFEELELKLKKKLASLMSRGSLNISLTLHKDESITNLSLNHQALNDVLSMIAEINEKTPNLAPSTAEGILGVRGVVNSNENELDQGARMALLTALEESFTKTIASLILSRQAEGSALKSVLEGQLLEIEALTDQAKKQTANIADQLQDKLTTQVQELAAAVTLDSDRLAQEIAILAVKADIREEIDRLFAHIKAARNLLTKTEPIGRKFDFLVQEFNREANTLCSKAASSDIKSTGLALKAVIDQMREQIQNIE